MSVQSTPLLRCTKVTVVKNTREEKNYSYSVHCEKQNTNPDIGLAYGGGLACEFTVVGEGYSSGVKVVGENSNCTWLTVFNFIIAFGATLMCLLSLQETFYNHQNISRK